MHWKNTIIKIKKLFLLLCVWVALPAVAQISDDKILIIDVSYLEQGSNYGQLGIHFNCYDSKKFALSVGLAGNFRSENRLVAIPEEQLSAWLRTDESHSGFIDIPVLMLRPQLNFSPITLPPKLVSKSSFLCKSIK